MPSNIILNGNFEQNMSTFCSSHVFCYETNSAIIAPWYIPCGSYNNIQVDTSQSAASGLWFLDLNSDMPYSIAQDVNLVVGQSYELTFDTKANNLRVPGINVTVPSEFTGTIQATGAKLQSFSTNSLIWSEISYIFTATQKFTTITIASTTAGSYGPFVDYFTLYPTNLSVPSLPSPAVNPLSSLVSYASIIPLF